MRVKTFFILFTLFIVFTFSVRIWQLRTNPAGVFADEASAGYDAYLILHTGMDRHGEHWPLFFKGFNYDNLSPYQVYFTVPFVALFGLNEFGIRLVPVFFSLIELIMFYLLLREFIPRSMAFLGMMLLSLSPWHFHLERINMGDYYSWTLLTIIACFFYVKAYKYEKNIWIVLSAIFFALASYSYVPARMLTPVFFGCLLVTLLLQRKMKHVLLLASIFVFFLLPFIFFHLTDPHSFQRIKDTMGIDVKNLETPPRLPAGQVLSKYLLHYSGEFLFFKGDTDFPGQSIRRHSIAGMGLLYPYQLWFIFLGIIWLSHECVKKKRWEGVFIFILLILFPLPDSLTLNATPYATRSYIGILPLHLLIGLGIYYLYADISSSMRTHRKAFHWLFSMMAVLTVSWSLTVLLIHVHTNPLSTSDFFGWQFGPRDIIAYFQKEQGNYDDFIMSGYFNGPEIFIPFYAPEGCRGCAVGDLTRLDHKRRQLFALRPEDISLPAEKLEVKKNILYPNGATAFVIFSPK